MRDTPAHDTAVQSARVAEFVHGLRFDHLPHEVVAQAQRCTLDLVGVAVAGRQTKGARIASDHAAGEMVSNVAGARMLLDGRRCSRAGAAFAGAATIDAFDAHDGHVLTKGHAGVAVLPALLAFVDAVGEYQLDGRELVAPLVVGYEVAIRAGIALHSTASAYHCSGAWNAIGCAAVGSRCLRLDVDRTRHALGIAEYFGTRGEMMRVCAIPTMVKDGSAWGAHAGASAALLAAEGFTGAPAATIDGNATSGLWTDLGARWRILEQYFKPYPVCRWAQPAIEAALDLARRHDVLAQDIARITIETFREAVALGVGCAYPANTEEAQYSLAYPVAAALATGGVGAREVGEHGVGDPEIRRLFDATIAVEDNAFSQRFPAERWARVHVALRNGRTFTSEPHAARGGPENRLSDGMLRRKYHELAEPALGPARTARIERLVDDLISSPEAARSLVDEVLSPLSAREVA